MRPLSTSTFGGILTAGLLAWTTAGAAGNQDIWLRTPGNSVTATLKGDNVESPDLQLYRSSSAVRGRAFGQPVDLSIKEDQVSGLVGGNPTHLKLTPQSGGGLEAKGLLDGALSNFKVTPNEISGTVGRCSYELHLAGDRYEGQRACGKRVESPVYLELPPSLAQGGDAQAVATLGLILGAR